MQTQTKFWSRLGMLGGVYAVLFVVANVLIGNEPGAGAAPATVVKYFNAHRAAETAGVFVVAFAVVALTFFLASLRHTLSRTDEGGYLANVVTAGGAVYAVGLLMMATFMLASVDAAHYHLAGTAQTLNLLSNDTWVPVVVGLSLLGLGTGVSALRSATLPKWLGWVSVVFGVLALAGPAGAIAFLIAPVWALVTGIVILRSSRTTSALVDPGLGGLTSVHA
ncbi:MAG: hypothetical protein WB565_08295 [Acidimicrobiales bacterium]